jgi:hypothetical protein
MRIGHARHFVINHGCHIDEIKVMKVHTPHLVTASSFISYMPYYYMTMGLTMP